MPWSEKVRRVRGVYSGAEADNTMVSDREVVEAASANVAAQNKKIAERDGVGVMHRSAMEDSKKAPCPLCGHNLPVGWYIDPVERLPFYPAGEVDTICDFLELWCNVSKETVNTLRPQQMAHIWNGHLSKEEGGNLYLKYSKFKDVRGVLGQYRMLVEDRENSSVKHIQQLEREGKLRQTFDLIAALRFHSAAIDSLEREHPVLLSKLKAEIRTPDAELQRLYALLPAEFIFNPKSQRRTSVYTEPTTEWEFPEGYKKSE